MEVALSIIGAVVAAVVALGGLTVKVREVSDGQSRQILRDLQILRELPDDIDASARSVLLEQTSTDIQSMVDDRRTKQRGWANFGIGMFGAVSAIALILLAIRGGWWLILLPTILFFSCIGLYGLIEGSIKGVRDARGNLVRKSQDTQAAND